MGSHVQAHWTSCRISDVATVVRGSSPRPAGDPRYFNGTYLPWATVSDVVNASGQYLTETATMLTQEGAHFTRILEPGTFLLTNSGARTLGVPKITKIRAGANDGIAALMNLNPNIVPEFLCYQLETMTAHFRNKVASGNDQLNLNTGLIGATQIIVPPVWEQHAIIEIGTVWDTAITTTAALVQAKVRFRQGLMQQLLSGTRRFKGYQDGWSPVQLRDVATECDERNRGRLGVNDVMGVTKAEGIVPMRERTIGADIARYLVVKKNRFAYNPMRINIGSIARWQGDRDILVSPDYVVFQCNEANDHSPGIDPDYLDHLRRSGIWENFVTAAGNGSVRVRIYFGDLGHLKFKLPSLPEQQKIATFLNAVDREIDLLREQLEALKQQKKGLMQKLLTGQVRVRVDHMENSHA